MNQLALVAFTGKGAKLCRELTDCFLKLDIQAEGFAPPRIAEKYGLVSYGEQLQDWSKKQFSAVDGMVFIGACGIAVRAIASSVRDKFIDPAVVVLDEQARFAVSLLSGHIGGANSLTEQVALLSGAQPVISTATDINGIFSVDSWAAEQGLFISDRSIAKMISVCLLEGKPVGITSDFPIVSNLPLGITVSEEKLGICISIEEKKRPFFHTLQLIPKAVTLGVGCRKGVDPFETEQWILNLLSENHISIHAVKQIASIDRKAREAALLAFCKKYRLEFQTYSAEQLSAVKGVFSGSAFVRQTVGVENVCERAATLASGGKLICRKQTGAGMTAALAVEPFTINFGLVGEEHRD